VSACASCASTPEHAETSAIIGGGSPYRRALTSWRRSVAVLVSDSKDPNDRRGVMLTLTQAGAERLGAYIDRGAQRERQLLEGLSVNDKRQLNVLLTKLVDSLGAELGR
jgi:hypothetical protein